MTPEINSICAGCGVAYETGEKIWIEVQVLEVVVGGGMVLRQTVNDSGTFKSRHSECILGEI